MAGGRFEGVELLDKGGMAAVYRAFDSRSGCDVAVKRLRSDLRESVREDLRELFHREYRILSELSHPRIIEVYDYGIDDEGPFYTMELLDGTDLRSKVPVPWQQACAIARDVCSSLALLHSRGYVHRDVSPANIWLTSTGEAKLLDFGAMAPMGICKMLVGVPACVAPEAVLQQQLDGRSDLFSLGATLYWALTGQRAFPAKKFSELESLHRQPPPRPATLVEEIPAAVERLVLQLVSIDPAARPRSAAEAIERLTAAADLPELESDAVPRSYLAVPALVGRDELVDTFRKQLRRLTGGRGGAVQLAGAQGMGRSRALDACVMEAKLAGAVILRSGSQDAADGSYGVLRSLVADLPAGLADQLHAGDPDGDVGVAGLVDKEVSIPDDPASRPAFHRALIKGVHRTSRKHGPLVFAVDDFADCDEPSQAALLALAHQSRRRAVMVLYTDTDDAQSFGDASPISTLRRLASVIEVSPLGEGELERLLASVFGDVPNLPIVARYIGQRAKGSPRVCMEFAQTLLDYGLARYEKGSWGLPSALEGAALPANLTEARRERFRELAPDVQEVAEVLALGGRHVAEPAKLAQACAHADRERTELALDVLVRAGIARMPSARAHLVDDLWSDVLQQELPAARKQEISRRLARLLANEEADPLWRVHLLLEGGEDEAAVALLVSDLTLRSRVDDAPFEHDSLLKRALEVCTRLGSTPQHRYPILRELARLCLSITVPGMHPVFHELLAYLTHDSGLDDWHALTDIDDSSLRLHRALEAAQGRFDGGRAYVLPPSEAIGELVRTLYEASAYATMTADSQMLSSLPSLEPLSPLSPGIGSIQNAVYAQRMIMGVKIETAIELYEARLRELESAGRGGLDEAQAQRSWFLVMHVIGTLHANHARDTALSYADELDRYEAGGILAAIIRHMYYERVGDPRQAERWGRRAEILQVQQKRLHSMALSALRVRVERTFLSEDLQDATRSVKQLEEVVEHFPSFQPYLRLARSIRDRIRGSHEHALGEAREILKEAQPGKDVVWPWAALQEVECLRLMGRLQEAKHQGLAYDQEMERLGMRLMRAANFPLVLAEAALGEFEGAMQRIDASIAYLESLRSRGMNIGCAYEFRALVALWKGDLEQFRDDAERCAAHFKEGRSNPALAARYERLMQEARSQGVSIGEQLEQATWGETSHRSRRAEFVEEPVTAALGACGTGEQRAGAALRVLCESVRASEGWLYLFKQQGPELVAGDEPDSSEVWSLAARLLGLEGGSDINLGDTDETEAVSDEEQGTPTGTSLSASTSDLGCRGIRLSFTSGEGHQVTGAAVFRMPTGVVPKRDISAVASAVSRVLSDAGDVVPRKLG